MILLDYPLWGEIPYTKLPDSRVKLKIFSHLIDAEEAWEMLLQPLPITVLTIGGVRHTFAAATVFLALFLSAMV